MNTVNTILIDDESQNRTVLRSLLTRHCPFINIVEEASGAEEAYTKINQARPQLVFLDIKMPVKSGFDLLKMFAQIDFEVIFVSAFNDYAITAFEFNALGYILKPVDFYKLEKAVGKAVAKIEANRQNHEVLHFVKTVSDKEDLINKISVHHNDRVVFLNIEEIVSVTSEENTCELKLANGGHYHSSKNIKLFEQMLEAAGSFIRINKSVIIQTGFIKSYTKGETFIIEMITGEMYEVSRRKKPEVLKKVRTY